MENGKMSGIQQNGCAINNNDHVRNKCVFLIAYKSVGPSGENEDNEYLGYNEYLGVEYIIAVLEQNKIECDLHFVSHTQLGQLDKFLDDRVLMIGLPLYTDTVELVMKIASQAKKVQPQAHICLGGPQTGGYSRNILEDNPFIDSVVEGEGEYTLLDLVGRLMKKHSLSGCKGLTHRERGHITREDIRKPIDSLDALPFPTRYIYEKYNQEYFYILGNRGCMGACSFCDEGAKKKIYGKPYVRSRSAVNIVDEMEYLLKKYELASFRFSDATFDDIDDLKQSKDQAVYQEIIKRGLKVRLHIFSRVELTSKKTMEELALARQAGVECVYLGIESANLKDIRLYRKNMSKAKAFQALNNLKQAGIHPAFGFIFFNPFSTWQGLKENADFLYKSNLGHVFYLYQTRLEVLAQSDIKERLLRENMADNISYRSDYHAYRFLIPQIEVLYKAVHQMYTKAPIYYMDTMLEMDKLWLLRNMEAEKWEKQLGAAFQRLEHIKNELAQLNYTTFIRCLNMAANNASEQQLIQYGINHGLDKYHEEIEKYYTKIKVKAKKLSYMQAKNKTN